MRGLHTLLYTIIVDLNKMYVSYFMTFFSEGFHIQTTAIHTQTPGRTTLVEDEVPDVSTDRLSIPEPSSEEKQDIKNEGACDSRVLVEEVAGLLTPDVGDKRYVVVQLNTKHPSIPDGTTLGGESLSVVTPCTISTPEEEKERV